MRLIALWYIVEWPIESTPMIKGGKDTLETKIIDEYNENGHLMWPVDFSGVFTRGKTRDEALAKFPLEIKQYLAWLKRKSADQEWSFSIVQEKRSELRICDADSDIIFDAEKSSLSLEDYVELKTLALKSAKDFETLYRSAPDKNKPLVPLRKIFYGVVPRTAKEMHEHTKNANSYYFREIGIPSDNEPDIRTCRLCAFEKLEEKKDFLRNDVSIGDYDEKWSLRKVCRRFVWHNRIHGKAVYRNSVRIFGKETIANPFCFVP